MSQRSNPGGCVRLSGTYAFKSSTKTARGRNRIVNIMTMTPWLANVHSPLCVSRGEEDLLRRPVCLSVSPTNARGRARQAGQRQRHPIPQDVAPGGAVGDGVGEQQDDERHGRQDRLSPPRQPAHLRAGGGCAPTGEIEVKRIKNIRENGERRGVHGGGVDGGPGGER